MGTFETALSSGDYDNVKALMDEESFAAFYLLNEYMKAVDFSQLSVYFYYKDGKFYAGPAWDFDLSTGNAGTAYGSSQNSLNSYDTARAANCHYYSYLMKYADFKWQVYQKYQGSKKYFREISAEYGWMDSFIKKYSEGIERNYADGLWEVSKRYSTLEKDPGSTYEENVAYLRDWCTHRADWLESYLEEDFDNGITQEEDGLYFSYGGERIARGLIRYENEFYYIVENGRVITDTDYEVTQVNGLRKPNGDGTFPSQIIHLTGWDEWRYRFLLRM